MKMRKHLRTKKLESITQLGIDRVVDLCFGRGENAYHILVELYASGNVILTDSEYVILSLLRSHKFDEQAKIGVRERYPFTEAAGMTIDTVYLEREQVQKFIVGEDEKKEQVVEEQPRVEENAGKGGKKPQKAQKDQSKKQDKKKDAITLKTVLPKMVPYINFPYAEHILKTMGMDPNMKAEYPRDYEKLVEAAKQCQEMAKNLDNQEIKGYLIYQEQ